MKTFIEEYRRMQNISLVTEYERQRQEKANLYSAMGVLKEALEKIANLTTGESSRIACQALDTVYPIKGTTKWNTF